MLVLLLPDSPLQHRPPFSTGEMGARPLVTFMVVSDGGGCSTSGSRKSSSSSVKFKMVPTRSGKAQTRSTLSPQKFPAKFAFETEFSVGPTDDGPLSSFLSTPLSSR